jgi:hypothetical protein
MHPGKTHRRLDCRASEWYEHHGSTADAVHHALAAGDFKRAASLIELAWPTMERNRQSVTWLRWVRALPEALLSGRPVRPDSAENNRYQARNCFQAALALFTVEKRQRDCACVWRDWGRFELNQGNQKRGEQLWQKARDLFVGIKLPLLVREMDAIRIQIGEQQGDKV